MSAPDDDRFDSEPTPDGSQPPANTPLPRNPSDEDVDLAWRGIVADLMNLSTNGHQEETPELPTSPQRPVQATQGPRDWSDDEEKLAQIDAFEEPDPPFTLSSDRVRNVGWFLLIVGLVGLFWTVLVVAPASIIPALSMGALITTGAGLLVWRMRPDDDNDGPGAVV
ncbi:hypothetical protein [Jonesia quinghaiensis]|uniref:hypothetical protein n=1 Tax=Jonesia quinghaiensis TaxID=262806 RepID=UPI00041D0FF5|nr:hypothetical protein [Jonesia quinghaiensis]